ncbi:hypothetical protein J3R82DRAFT_5210 [Butyriboletus roseoflavus]|nr:hypothetical protein J3R82DRAFT_5210 [Butyriboletus roseoflavus]
MSSTTHVTALMHANEQLYRFPPFPAPPEGVMIVPFSAFAPAGYLRVTDPSGVLIEVDGWAKIPTVKVSNEEEAAQKRKARRKQRNAGNTMDAEGKLIPWWEEWEEGEALRAMTEASFNSHTSFEDRVCLAADDFRLGRTWPEIAQGVRLMWDHFRIYIGLISSIPIYKKVKNSRKGQVDGPNNGDEASDEEDDVPRAKQTKVVIVQDYLEQSALPGKQLEPSPNESIVEAQRLRTFLDDMEKTVKVFLSSYLCDTGLIWTEKNLFIAPTVLHFFLRFMLRNRVFADSTEHLDTLKRALSVAAFAQKELPLTAKLGQILPGHFDLACKECWGIKGSLSIQISATLPPADVDNTQTNGTPPPSETSSTFETDLKEHDIEVVPSDVVLDSITARQVMENNLDTDHEVPVTTIPVAGDPWTAAIRAEEYTTASWTDPSVPWLMQLLGPSVFPLTMTTGIVESSTRRIRDVIAPGANPVDETEIGHKIRTASIVEAALEEKFYRVVMRPRVGSVSEETVAFPRPVIMPGSRGAVVAEVRPEGVNVDEDGDGGEEAWNPYRDDVVILVDGEVAGHLVNGMVLYGTWVQMVPERGGKRHAGGCYWYIESLVASFPSYYIEGEMIWEVLGEEDEG